MPLGKLLPAVKHLWSFLMPYLKEFGLSLRIYSLQFCYRKHILNCLPFSFVKRVTILSYDVVGTIELNLLCIF